MLESETAPTPAPAPPDTHPVWARRQPLGNAVLGSAVSHSLSGYIGYLWGGSSPAIPGVRGLGVWGEGGGGGRSV